MIAAMEQEPGRASVAIRFRMEQLGLDRKALEKSIGSRARVSEVLTRRRDLSLGMIRRLHRDFDIPAEILIGARSRHRPGRRRGNGADALRRAC